MRVTGTTPEYLVGVLVPPRSTDEDYGYCDGVPSGGTCTTPERQEGMPGLPGAPGRDTRPTLGAQEGRPGLTGRARRDNR